VYRHRLGHLFNEKRDVIRFFSATFFIVLLDVAFILEVFQRLLLSLEKRERERENTQNRGEN
jgi:hypothetical protein